MKKILLLLSLHFVFTNAFSQTTIFSENFKDGRFNNDWNIVNGKWTVENLENKGFKFPGDNNKFGLSTAGDAEIATEIPIKNMDPANIFELSFTSYNRFYAGAPYKIIVNIVLLDENGKIFSSTNYERTPMNHDKPEQFNQHFKCVRETTVIRMKLGVSGGGMGSAIYFRDILLAVKKL